MTKMNNSIAVEKIDPERAREFLQHNYKYNRPLRKQWVDFLCNEMNEGRFVSTAEIHLVYCNGVYEMVNGQHTSAAIIKHGKPVTLTLRRTIVNDINQIAMLYAFGHDNGIKRNFNDQLGAYNISESIGLGPTRTQELSTALRHIRAGFFDDSRGRSRSVPAPALPELLIHIEEWAPFARMFLTEIQAKDGAIKNSVAKRGAFAVVLVTYRYQLSMARTFWRGVLAPDDQKYNDPRSVARRVLEDSKSNPGSKPVSPALLSRQLSRCWRGFWNQEIMGQKPKLIDENAPMAIVGTPFTGKQPEPPWWPDCSDNGQLFQQERAA